MEWWTLFFRVRRVIFALLAITSFLWAIALSVYISREWPHFDLIRRILILAVIGINVFTSVLLYLMIVVVFRVWLDFARVLFLLLLYVGIAIMFWIFGRSFSCAIFASEQLCMTINWAFVLGSWSIAGLYLVYICYLLAMVPIPRPAPKVTPNLLLDGYTDNKRGSTSSISSATGLLDESTGTLRSSPSNFQQLASPEEASNRYMTNTAFSAPVSRASTRTTTYSRAGGSYGAMGTPGAPVSASRPEYRASSVRSYSTRASGIPPSLKSSFNRPMEQRRSQEPGSKPFPLPNPFADPLSRYGTPASTYSTVSHNGKPMDVESGYLIERYQPLVPMPVPPSARSGYGPPPVPSLPSTPAYSVTGKPEPYTFPPLSNPFDPPHVRSAGGALRVATMTPHSFHSVAPSWHLVDATQQTTTSVPQPAHVRGSSDVTYRSHTTSPRIYSVVEASLPNPFPPAMNSGGEVRRFGSMSGPDSGAYHGGHGGTYLSYGRDADNAAHLVGALGTAPPRAEAATTTDPMRWKRLVMSAASGRID